MAAVADCDELASKIPGSLSARSDEPSRVALSISWIDNIKIVRV